MPSVTKIRQCVSDGKGNKFYLYRQMSLFFFEKKQLIHCLLNLADFMFVVGVSQRTFIISTQYLSATNCTNLH